MSRDQILAFFVVVLGASGTYLLLPHKHGATKPRNTHLVGAGLSGLALVLFAFFWSPPGPWVSGLFFYAFAFASVASAVLTVTSRNPVHSALWFAAVVLSTSGLFLQAGASFLAAGTVIVYAGAIIVTFLFVIMLAQMEGRAPYDRAARMPFLSTWICYLLFFGVLWSLFNIKENVPSAGTVVALGPIPDSRLPRAGEIGPRVRPGSGTVVAEVLARSVRPTARLVDMNGLLKPHVAGLGETLYTDHLMTVELTGALLFVALVGAVAIATPKPPVRPNETRGSTTVTASTATPTTANV